MNIWDDIAAALWDPCSDTTMMRSQYALQHLCRIILDSHCDHIRRHVAMYATWHCGHINPDALADSLCDHLRDVTPLPVDAVEELLT